MNSIFNAKTQRRKETKNISFLCVFAPLRLCVLICLTLLIPHLLHASEKIVYIVPGQWGDIFAFDNPMFNRDDCLEPIRQLKERCEANGVELRQTYSIDNLEPFEALFMFEVPVKQPYSHISLDRLEQLPKERLVLFLWEPPSVAPENYDSRYHSYFSKIYTWHDGLVDDETYLKLFYPVLKPMIKERIPFASKKLATLIACNKHSTIPGELYSERVRLIQFYEHNHPEDFDLYGKWWPESYRVYGGAVSSKVDVLKHYKFAFAYENIKGIPGYVTEKIFDCFQAGCVPVYFGAPNVADYVPKQCFISREDFASDEELYQYLVQMDQTEYNRYLSNIESYLQSDQAKQFSAEHFVQTISEMMLQNGLFDSAKTHCR